MTGVQTCALPIFPSLRLAGNGTRLNLSRRFELRRSREASEELFLNSQVPSGLYSFSKGGPTFSSSRTYALLRHSSGRLLIRPHRTLASMATLSES